MIYKPEIDFCCVMATWEYKGWGGGGGEGEGGKEGGGEGGGREGGREFLLLLP